MRLLDKIEHSFVLAMKGEEKTNNLIIWWGIAAYLITYFVLNKLIYLVDNKIFDVALSLLVIVYFSWHIYVIRKSLPPKPKLTKEEKQRLKLQKRQEFSKKFFRKLFLQESIGKWDSAFVSNVVDLLFIVHFLGYI
jgi:hypothetical protein